MSRPVKLYDLGPSPNSTKARLALALRKIPYEKIPVDPNRREPVIQISGQPLTPVLVHGDTVIFDSSAIVRYVDANFPGEPRLFSPVYETMKKIEEWETFGRMEAGEPIRITFREAFSASPDAARLKKANDLVQRAASRTEEALAGGPYLMGAAITAADILVAPYLNLAALPAAAASHSPIAAFFVRNLRIEGTPRTRAWIERVMALDR
jgi:glutathione S-transferase